MSSSRERARIAPTHGDAPRRCVRAISGGRVGRGRWLGFQQPNELLQRERSLGELGAAAQPVAMLAGHADDEIGVTRHLDAGPCAPRVRRCRPPARRRPHDSAIAPDPSHPAVPADDTAGAASANRRRRASRRNPSAIGERQMLPVQITRMDVMEPGHPGGGESNSGTSPPRTVRTLRSISPERRIQRPVREIDDRRRDSFERSLLAQVDGDQVAERRRELVAGRGRGCSRTVRARRRRARRSEPARRAPADAGHPDPDRLAIAAQIPPSLTSARGSTIVSGPGQNAAASRSARASNRATVSAVPSVGTSTGSVRSRGRRLASNSRRSRRDRAARRRSRTRCRSGTRSAAPRRRRRRRRSESRATPACA